MDDAWDVSKQREQDIDPEMRPDPDLQEDTQWRKQDRENQTKDIHGRSPIECEASVAQKHQARKKPRIEIWTMSESGLEPLPTGNEEASFADSVFARSLQTGRRHAERTTTDVAESARRRSKMRSTRSGAASDRNEQSSESVPPVRC